MKHALLLLLYLNWVPSFGTARLTEWHEEKDDAIAHNPNGVNTHPNGVVTVPSSGKMGPSSQSGGSRLKTSDVGGKHVQYRPGDVGTWLEWTLDNEEFPTPKLYEVTMRIRTDFDQDDVTFEMRRERGNDDDPTNVLFRTTVVVPDTGGEWFSTEPVAIPIPIGGFQDLYFRVTCPTIQGGMFHLRDFDFIPPGAFDTGEFSAFWFGQWYDRVLEYVKLEYIPELPSDNVLVAYNASADYLNLIIEDEKGMKEPDEKEEYRQLINVAYDSALETVRPTLEDMDVILEEVDHQDPQWLQAIILFDATPLKMADYCREKGEEACRRLVTFLETDTQRMYEYLKFGGVRGGWYGQALDVHNHLLEQVMTPGYDVLPKLAMAVALELTDPQLHYDDPVLLIDPVERYKHYEEAYLNAELDPHFENLSVWELRNVVNSDAPNEQLVWARQMLRDFRPDIVTFEETNWRYNRIMPTDVTYTKPSWKEGMQRDYMQIISGGGLCGPRAQFARFISRSFGVPAWGIVKPGHATYAKWYDRGWTDPLGRRWWYGWWEDRDAHDWFREADIRRELGDDVYFQQVESLLWFARLMGEWQTGRGGGMPNSENPWTGLSLLQRYRLYDSFDKPTATEVGDSQIYSSITEMMLEEHLAYEPMMFEGDSLVVAVMSRTTDNGEAVEHSVEWMKSWLGGMQLHLHENGVVEYDIPANMVPERKTVMVKLLIAAVHEDDPNPFKLAISSSATGETVEYEVPFKYTYGVWEWTDAIDLELGGGDENIKLYRDAPCESVSIKELVFTPL